MSYTNPDIGYNLDFLQERYTDIVKVASGGMGCVLRAHDNVLKRLVAIKVLTADSASPEPAIRFQKEAQAASKFNHPNLVNILDFGASPDGHFYLIMDYVDGVTFSDYIELNGKFREEETVKYLIEIAEAVHHIHSHGVIHRDLKLSNIMLTSDGTIKIIDFGIAKLQSEEINNQSLTTTGTIIGSPLFMAPEQVKGQSVDYRCDIYSFGCVMFNMLTGHPPFQAESAVEVMSMHLKNVPPDLREDASLQYAANWNSIKERMLKKNPDDRYQNFDEILLDLNSIGEESQVPPVLAPGRRFEDIVTLKTGITILSLVSLIVISAIGIFSMLPKSDIKEERKVKLQTEKYVEPPFSEVMSEGRTQWVPASRSKITSDDLNWLKDRTPHPLLLRESAFSGRGLKYLKDWDLKSFRLEQTKLDDIGMKELALFKNAVYLELSHTLITDKGLSELKSDRLEIIYLNDCKNITDDGVRNLIERCPRIKRLGIGSTGCTAKIFPDLLRLELSELDLYDLDLRDEDLWELTKLKSLNDLELHQNKEITDNGVRVLGNFQHLDFVNLRLCSVKGEGVKYLEKKFPGIDIRYDGDSTMKTSAREKIEKIQDLMFMDY